MDAFSAFGVAAFCIAVCMLGFPSRVKNWKEKSEKENMKRKEGSPCPSF